MNNKNLVEFKKYIKNVIKNFSIPDEIKEILEYVLIGEGKYIRPQIFFAYLEDMDLDVKLYFDLALSIEMIHTYSLVHDDLPAIDDDDMRRGKASCHKKYGEDVAILVGDMLLTNSFEQILKNKEISENKKLEIIKRTIDAAGINGMILGQYIDIKQKAKNILELDEMHNLKTSKMLTLPLIIGSIINNYKDLESLSSIGQSVGLLYQIQDDYLDVYGKDIGKNLNSDAQKNKRTYTYYYTSHELEQIIFKKKQIINTKLNVLDNNPKLKLVLESILERVR